MAADLTYKIKAAVVSVIKGLALPGIKKVLNQLAFDSDTVQASYPCIVVMEVNLIDEVLPGDTEAEWRYWPVGILICDRESMTSTEKEQPFLLWRKTLTDYFHQIEFHGQDKLVGVPEVSDCKVVPQQIFDTGIKEYQMIRSSMILKFLTVEDRR